MKKTMLLAVMLSIPLALVTVTAHAAYVLFDDLATSGGYGTVPAAYKGFTWNGFEVVSQATYQSTATGGWANTTAFPSVPNAAYNGNGAATVTLLPGNGYPITFGGADFWTWTWQNSKFVNSADVLTVTGWLNGVQVGHDTFDLNGTPQARYDGYGWLVDKVTFERTVAGGTEGYWLMDCVQVASTPVPPSLYLLAAGLVGTLVARRRRRTI
jgi:hypothetical protein